MSRETPEINSIKLYEHPTGELEPVTVKGMENTGFVMVDDSQGDPISVPQSKLHD